MLLIISLISFIAVHLAPNSFFASGELNPNITEESIQQLKEIYNLNQPLHIQFISWVQNIVQLDFGISFSSGEQVKDEIISRLPITLTINLISMFLIFIISLYLGIKAALNQNSTFDKIIKQLSIMSFAMPSFYLALLLIILLAAYFYQPFEKQAVSIATHQLQLDPKYQAKAVELSQQEADFFVNNGSQAQKYSLKVNHKNKRFNASMVLVWSKQWRSQHIPENCYLSQGYSINQKGLWSITPQNGSPQNSLRYLSLNKKQANGITIKNLTGVYWFQSARKITPDYSSRVMDALFHPSQEWVMVSILWEKTVIPDIISPFISQLQSELQYDN